MQRESDSSVCKDKKYWIDHMSMWDQNSNHKCVVWTKLS